MVFLVKSTKNGRWTWGPAGEYWPSPTRHEGRWQNAVLANADGFRFDDRSRADRLRAEAEWLVRVSVPWVEAGAVYATVQRNNPGPHVVARVHRGGSAADRRRRGRTRTAVDNGLAVDGPVEVSARLANFPNPSHANSRWRVFPAPALFGGVLFGDSGARIVHSLVLSALVRAGGRATWRGY